MVKEKLKAFQMSNFELRIYVGLHNKSHSLFALRYVLGNFSEKLAALRDSVSNKAMVCRSGSWHVDYYGMKDGAAPSIALGESHNEQDRLNVMFNRVGYEMDRTNLSWIRCVPDRKGEIRMQPKRFSCAVNTMLELVMIDVRRFKANDRLIDECYAARFAPAMIKPVQHETGQTSLCDFERAETERVLERELLGIEAALDAGYRRR